MDVILTSVGEAPDTRQDYGECRMNSYGFIRGRLCVCTYTMRGQAHRIISVRKRTERNSWSGYHARRFAIPIGTLRDWEQGRAKPDGAAMAYLRVIHKRADMVAEALAV